MEQLNMKLVQDNSKEEAKALRVATAQAKKKAQEYQPTWEEVWYTGYGEKKRGIFQMKSSAPDKERLLAVKDAIDSGELGNHVESLKKFTKSHAMNLYKILAESRRSSIIADMILHKPDNYHLVNTVEQFESFLQLTANEPLLSVDTETDGLDYDINHIVGLSFTLPNADYHCYIPVRHTIALAVQLDPVYVFKALAGILQDESIGKVFFNAKFDFHMLYKEGIYVRGLVMDVMIAMGILNENEPSNKLKDLATKYGKYFGFEDRSAPYEELFGKGGFENTPFDIGTVYACKDTHLTYAFYVWVDEQLSVHPNLHHIYYDIELPNTIVAFDLELNGLLVDLEFATDITATLQEELHGLELKLAEIFGDVNLNSPAQLAVVIYDTWGTEDPKGKRSVDADTIEFLAMDNENLSILLEYRKLSKLLSTYFEPLPQKIWGRDGRLHGKYKQTGTKTGRYSSAEPNMQNLPPKARPMFVAPAGKVIIGKDLSQIEPRCLAYMSGDKQFQESYLQGKDLYSTLASSTFKMPLENCLDGCYDPTGTFQPRKRMKTGLLAVMYGTSTYTLSKQLNITSDEAVAFIQDFLDSYPQTKDYIQSIKDFVDANGYVLTREGRKRRFPKHKEIARQYKAVAKQLIAVCGEIPTNIWDAKWKKKIPYNLKQAFWKVASPYNRVHRQAVNSVIQGSSADYIKQVMYRVSQYLKTLGADYKMVGSIHDEILMEVPDTITAETISQLDHIMTSISWFKFPVKTDTVVMYKWGQEIAVKDWLQNREQYNLKRTA